MCDTARFPSGVKATAVVARNFGAGTALPVARSQRRKWASPSGERPGGDQIPPADVDSSRLPSFTNHTPSTQPEWPVSTLARVQSDVSHNRTDESAPPVASLDA